DYVVALEGVVTAAARSQDVPRFWLQSATGDGDDLTSDAVEVTMSPGAEPPGAGNRVRVNGKVQEAALPGELSTTRILASSVQIVSRGVAPPTAVILGEGGRRPPTANIDGDRLQRFRPDRDAIDFFESLEGMRVEIRNPVVIGPSTPYGSFVVLPDDGNASSLRSRRGGLLLTDNDFNPERLLIDSRLIGSVPEVKVGDRFTGPIFGVLGYDRGDFKILATGSFPRTTPAAYREDVTLLDGDETHLTVATYNVLNLSPAVPGERFSRLAETIVKYLKSPDILALQEVQDNSGPTDDGTVAADQTLRQLVAAIQTAGGPTYGFRQISPKDGADGGQPGGNIRVAYLFDVERVVFVDRGSAGPTDEVKVELDRALSQPRLNLSPGRVFPSEPAFAGDPAQGFEGNRKSLAAEFFFQGRQFFLINNHLKSKRGDDRLFGDPQPPLARTELQRRAQTLLVRRLVDQILAESPTTNVVVLGDMNEHEFRSPIRTLTDNQITPLPLSNLIEWVPVDDRYTYNYLGNSQVLDHVLVSPNLVVNGSPEIDIVHVNADFPAKEAASDHDPVVVRLRVSP
ncbi:MAG: endonuclease/exonuclease/phosphatase family protein, partial [Acidobacteria bacterium]|nr:endonuclease/exonuclease/phosphatase family protein [Acidobacteriota bacterium]